MPKFRGLPSDDARYLYLYYFTNAHQTIAGCYHLPDHYVIGDLGWTIDQYIASRSALIDADMIVFDEETSELMVVGWFEANGPRNQKHRQGILTQIGQILSASIRERAHAGLNPPAPEESPLVAKLRGRQW